MAKVKLIKSTNIIHRFSDVDGEPCIMLPPIEGYGNMPLVSIDEAVEPLISIVQDVKARAITSKQHARTPSDKLSIDESASIALYTMEWEPYTHSLYYILNSVLRAEDREQLKPWFLYLKLLLSALDRLPSIRLTVYRSLKLDPQMQHEKYQEGKDVIWWGFSSCTTNKNISEKQHFSSPTGVRVLFIIKCSNGKYIGPHALNENDQEVLLLPATQFEVVRCNDHHDDIHKIYMKEVQAQSVLLEPVFAPAEDETSQKSSTSANTRSTTRESIRKFFSH